MQEKVYQTHKMSYRLVETSASSGVGRAGPRHRCRYRTVATPFQCVCL